MSYEQALSHVNKCQNEKYLCPFCSNFELLGKDMDQHLIECPNYEEQCPQCRLMVKRCDFDSHDCFEVLKKACAEKERQLTEIKSEYGLPDTHFQPMCNKKHLLKPNRGRVLTYGGAARCDRCKEVPLEKHEIFYHCPTCKYDSCRACALERTKLVGVDARIFQHEHVLTKAQANRDPSWTCKVRNCLSGIKEGNQSRFT